MSRWLLLLVLCGPMLPSAAAPLPAKRLVSLAPNLTELVYASGAGFQLAGVVAWSDYPEAARRLPVVGDAFRLDFERIMTLRPDLVLAWGSGTPRENIERLRALGLRVESVPIDHLDEIPLAMERIGEWAGTGATARLAAGQFREALAARRAVLRSRQGTGPRVFIQVGRNPYYTVSDRHLIGEVVTLCGGRNVFGGLGALAPVVGEEDIVATRPEVILVLDDGNDGAAAAAAWQRWRQLPAVRNGRVHTVSSSTLARATPRVLAGIAAVCAILQAPDR
ncbi:MAG: cobalamin-binding protein [Gammaproteobacteria bacterium]